MKKLVPLSILLLALGGYSSLAQSGEMSTSPPSQSAPDNTARNIRDRSGKTLTPGDQTENEADRALTQRIRQAVMADDSLSTTAKNIKIITVNGVVTLRGPVDSKEEKASINTKAQQIAGVKKVDNQLEVAGR